MKNILFTLVSICVLNAFAEVETATVRVASGVMPNPALAPLGQLVNIKNGEVLYVNSVISVLTPDQLAADCVYQISFTRDTQIKSRVQLVHPMQQIICGQEITTYK